MISYLLTFQIVVLMNYWGWLTTISSRKYRNSFLIREGLDLNSNGQILWNDITEKREMQKDRGTGWPRKWTIKFSSSLNYLIYYTLGTGCSWILIGHQTMMLWRLMCAHWQIYACCGENCKRNMERKMWGNLCQCLVIMSWRMGSLIPDVVIFLVSGGKNLVLEIK